jgi:ankyrin repeat protein
MSDGATPLHWAAQEGMDTNVSLLLAAGAQIFPDSNGETALHSACMNGHLSSAKLVTQHFGPTLVNSGSCLWRLFYSCSVWY